MPSASSSSVAATALVATLTLLVVARTWDAVARHLVDPRLRDEWTRVLVWSAVLCAWPVAWAAIGGARCCGPWRLGFAWPYLLFAANTLLPQDVLPAAGGAREGGGGSALRIEPGPLLSVALAMVGVLQAGRDVDHVRFFVAPVGVLLLAASPQPLAVAQGEARVALEAAQAAVVACAAGVILGGIVYRKGEAHAA